MSKAYRQIRVASEHLKHSVVCAWSPVEGRWVFAILHGRAFGLVRAVLTFNRNPFFFSALAWRWIGIPCTNFHYDFKLHTTVHDGGSASHYFDRLMANSCLEWTAKVRDQLQQIFEGAPFSMSEAASEHGRLQSFNAILEGRASRSQTVAFSQLANGFVSSCDNVVTISAQFGFELFVMVPPPWRQYPALFGETQPKHLQRRENFLKSHSVFGSLMCCLESKGWCNRDPLACLTSLQETRHIHCSTRVFSRHFWLSS